MATGKDTKITYEQERGSETAKIDKNSIVNFTIDVDNEVGEPILGFVVDTKMNSEGKYLICDVKGDTYYVFKENMEVLTPAVLLIMLTRYSGIYAIMNGVMEKALV